MAFIGNRRVITSMIFKQATSVWGIDTTSQSPITLTNNIEFRLGEISDLTIELPDEISQDFMSEIVFIAASGITMDYSSLNITWSGDDVSENAFVPVEGKTYNILFFNNSATDTPSIQAIVRGVTNG